MIDQSRFQATDAQGGGMGTSGRIGFHPRRDQAAHDPFGNLRGLHGGEDALEKNFIPGAKGTVGNEYDCGPGTMFTHSSSLLPVDRLVRNNHNRNR